MKSKLLLSVSAIVLITSLGVARADDYDTTLAGLVALQVGVPPDAFSKSHQDEMAQVKGAIDTINADKKTISQTQANLAQAQKDLSGQQASADSISAQYQAAADKVAVAKDALDNVISLYKNSTPQRVLTDATNSLRIATQTAITAANTLQAYSGLPDSDPRKKEAITANHDAQNIVVEKQAAANRAGEIAKQANLTSAAVIVAAQSNYNTAYSVIGDPATKTGLAYQKSQAISTLEATKATIAQAPQTISVIQGSMDRTKQALSSLSVTTLNDINADVKVYLNKQQTAAAPTPAPLAVGGSTTPAAGTPAITPTPIVVPGAPVVSNDGGSLISSDSASLKGSGLISGDSASLKGSAPIVSEHGAGVMSDNGLGLTSTAASALANKPTTGIISDNTEGLKPNAGTGLLSEHGAGLTSSMASALLATNSATGLISNQAAVTSSDAFKQDSSMSAFSNIDTSTPGEKWQKAVGNLSKADQQTLSDLKAAIAKTPNMQLSQAQIDLVSKVTKSLDTQTVQSLEQVAVKNADITAKTSTLNQAVTTMVVNQAIANAKSDPVVGSAVVKIAAGATPSATETQHVKDVVATAVDKLPISADAKKDWHQRTREHVAVVVAPPPPKTAVVVQSAPPALPPEVVNQFVSAGPAVIAALHTQAQQAGKGALADGLGADVTSLLTQFVPVGPAVITGLQAQQQTALKTGNTALAASLATDIATLQKLVAEAPKQPVTATVQPTTSSSPSVTPVSLTSTPATGEQGNTRRDSEQRGNTQRERDASTNREREPERSANTRREREHEREANTRREHEHEREANTRRDREPEHSARHERAREANTRHEGSNSGNHAHTPSTTTRNTATYTAASASKAPPPPKLQSPSPVPPKH